MGIKIFVNLPVKDLNRSMKFFKSLGFHFNEKFTDERAACLVISDDIYSMLITEEFFKTFIKKEIADSSGSTEAIISLLMESREKVDEVADKALKAGGKIANDPVDDGFMYTRSFYDPDDHLWEVLYMDPSTAQ